MKVLPILFNSEMVRAILEKRKTVTRRVIKSQPPIDFRYPQVDDSESRWWWTDKDGDDDMMGWWPSYENGLIPPYKPGDILYVRETWAKIFALGKPYFIFKADDLDGDMGRQRTIWRPSIHMPKEAARIFLRVKSVRVERLHDITEEHAIAEGARYSDFGLYVPPWKMSVDGGKTFHEAKPIHHPGYHFKDADRPDQCFEFARSAFANYWSTTIKAADRAQYGWAANPWVWVIEFERVDKPEGWPI